MNERDGPVGHKRWVIADGYIPPASTGTSRPLRSHDAICILTCGDEDAHVDVMIFFSDRKPAGPTISSSMPRARNTSASMN